MDDLGHLYLEILTQPIAATAGPFLQQLHGHEPRRASDGCAVGDDASVLGRNLLVALRQRDGHDMGDMGDLFVFHGGTWHGNTLFSLVILLLKPAFRVGMYMIYV